MAATHNNAWSYAVPLEETDGNARPYSNRPESINEKDPKGLQKRTSAWDLMSDSETAKQRRTSMRESNAAAGRKRSRNQLRDKLKQPEKKGEHVDDSAWIHRDKLAQIEIQEMAAAGISPRKPGRSESVGANHEDGRTSRSVSRSGLRRPASRTSHERQHEIAHDDEYNAAYPIHEESPKKRVSTVLSASEDEVEAGELRTHPVARGSYDPYRDSEFRSATETAAELAQRQQVPRPGTSRIPVSRISPVPVPQTVVDRDAPLPRSRAGSQNWSGSFDEMQYARKARSGSMSSAVLLDSDADGARITPPGSSNKTSSNDGSSPPVSKVPKKAATHGQKASITSGGLPRPGSSHQQDKKQGVSSATNRNDSGSGHRSRPSTSHEAPGGDAPWLATMYKPDPRLPPDQQMLPTHAKRMMQEQWEREGKTGTAYDKDFRLLNDDELPQPKPPVLTLDSHALDASSRSLSPTKLDKSSPNESATGPWPLSPARSDARSETSARPGTSGGYKITPTIPQTPTMQRSPAPSPVPPPTTAAQDQTTRIPDLDEKSEAAPKKGCCCVVM